MKPIQIKKTTIDIPFNDENGKEVFVLHFDRSDENVERFSADYEKLMNEINLVDKNTKIVEARPFIKEFADTILGEGSFDKMFAVSPSSLIVVFYIAQIAIGIKDELEDDELKELERQLLGEDDDK